MSKASTLLFAIQPLESRTMLTAAPGVVGYLPDYNYAKLGSESGGFLAKVNWGALTQINYFSIVPDAVTAALPTHSSDAFSNSLTQLSDVVTQAHAHNVKVSIVIGGADLDASLTAIAAK